MGKKDMDTSIKEVEFRPCDPAKDDCFCADGELEAWGGCVTPGIDGRFRLEAGELVAMHQGRAVVYSDGQLMWGCAQDGGCLQIDGLETIAVMERPMSVAMLGDTLVTTGAGGLMYHQWTGSGYSTLPQLPELPEIEFGLLKEGEMADACSIVVPVSMVPSAGGNGMSDPHPSANTTGGDDTAGYIDKIVERLIDKAHDDKRKRGYFTSTFMVRYAVRDRGGHCLRLSPPVLMAGGVLPPCMEVTYTGKTEKEAIMRVRLNSCPYFSLVARAKALEPEWAGVIGGIDIYVSPQIPAYDSGAGYLCRYSTVLGQLNNGVAHRGRDTSDSGGDAVFAGHYSDDGVNFVDHYTDASLRQTDVWYVAPNVGLASDIVCESRFYRVASIGVTDLNGMADFTKVNLESTAMSKLEKSDGLDDEPDSVEIYPEALTTLSGRIVAAGGNRGAVQPVDLAVSAAFAGSAHSASSIPVVVSVYTRDGGVLRRISRSSIMSADIGECFPRYIYHPDVEASLMIIECGGREYRLPLTRHTSMPGVYWMGGLGADCTPPRSDAPLPLAVEDRLIACDYRVWLSSPGSVCHFTQGMVACNSRIVAVSASMVAADMSALGKYPVYVFADDGVWLAEYDSDRCRMCGSHRISGEVCASVSSVAVTPDGVVFATRQSLMIVSGAKVKRLMPLPLLPGAALPELPGVSLPEFPDEATEGGVSLAYDGVTSSLIVVYTDSGMTYICDMTVPSAGVWGWRTAALPLVTGRTLIQTSTGDVVYLAPQTTATAGSVLVTRPIKLTKAFVPKIIRSVTVWHDGAPDSVSVNVYGANSLASWHLIASSACHRVEIVNRTPWRFLRLSVIPRRPTAIYGAQIEWLD